MVSRVFFQIDENHTIYKAIVAILTDQLLVASINTVSVISGITGLRKKQII